MIASRFRSLAWVAAFAACALCCYLVTQRVAGERQALAKVERRILAAKRDVRRLETEIETRGRLPQLEQWNEEVLALSAPRASQFLGGELQLASLTRPALPPVDPAAVPAPAAVQLASAPASAAPAAPVVVAQADPMIRRATYLKPKGAPLPLQVASLDDAGFAAELERIAATEAASARTKR